MLIWGVWGEAFERGPILIITLVIVMVFLRELGGVVGVKSQENHKNVRVFSHTLEIGWTSWWFKGQGVRVLGNRKLKFVSAKVVCDGIF